MRLVIVLFALSASVCFADITVEIVHAPDGVILAYSPTYIIGKIQNNGIQPVLVPIDENSDMGWSLQVSSANGRFPLETSYEQSKSFDRAIWIEPGDNYWFARRLGSELSKPGVYELRFVLRSSGQCSIHPVGLEKHPLVALTKQPGIKQLYQCWQGDIKSENAKISVADPINADDQSIIGSILSGEFVEGNFKSSEILSSLPIEVRFSMSYPFLKDHYPNSYYTYAAGLYRAAIYGGGVPFEVVEEIMQMQPNHQLAETAETIWALSVISDASDANYGAAAQKRLGHIKDLKLPVELHKYLEQYRLVKGQETQIPTAN